MEIVVASGKGGTGKTFLSSNMAIYLRDKGGVVAVDADVEAPDLLLALGGARRVLWREEYYGAKQPTIDYAKCIRCWMCVKACEFGALAASPKGPVVDYDRCEGLGTCSLVCPVNAIQLVEAHTGAMYAAESEAGITVITGDLDLGQGASGRLVYELKERAYELSRERNARYRVVDAAPGIGCPVISSIAGADVLIVVVEPTPQSVKGAKRLVEVADMLRVKTLAVVNKYDLNPDYARSIPEMLEVEVVGRVPYDEAVVRSYTLMKPLLTYSPRSKAAQSLLEIFSTLGF
ncbi:MAG: ATPase [Thermoprotei archaeon]|nr:MAG: ATPase [Thermoprotei archaeon]